MNRSSRWTAFIALGIVVVALRAGGFIYFAFAHPTTRVGQAASASAPYRMPRQDQ
jgi:hypothetical protein